MNKFILLFCAAILFICSGCSERNSFGNEQRFWIQTQKKISKNESENNVKEYIIHLVKMETRCFEVNILEMKKEGVTGRYVGVISINNIIYCYELVDAAHKMIIEFAKMENENGESVIKKDSNFKK